MNRPSSLLDDDLARQAALSTARGLEQAAEELDFVEDLLLDALEVVADTRGVVTLVLSTGGPHVELVLADGFPRVAAWWGSHHATVSVSLDERLVEDICEQMWRPTMLRALEEPPY